jgi:hypothetical protein
MWRKKLSVLLLHFVKKEQQYANKKLHTRTPTAALLLLFILTENRVLHGGSGTTIRHNT